MSESPKVLASFEITDGVALIKLDDGKANALSLPMQQAFNSALDQAQQAKLPVVITGRSGILSAGFDLKTLAASGQPAVDMLNGGIEIALRLLSFETPEQAQRDFDAAVKHVNCWLTARSKRLEVEACRQNA